MDHSLINTNQIQMMGMSFSDDSFDENLKLGIGHKKVFIPFNNNKTTLYFDSIVPTQHDIMEFTNIIMTVETEWEPQSVRLALVRTKEEEESRKICEIARAPKVYELETDGIMGSIGYMFVERAMIEQLIASINVWCVKVKDIESNARHSVINPEEVSRKFNIGINRLKYTLRVTTQTCIRHAVHPLHRIYRVYNIQLNRKRLDAKLYTDHLLAKTDSLEGNTGAYIYTTGNFTVAYTCIKLSEEVDALQRFADDAGVPDILRSDLAPDITGKHM